MKPKSRQKTIRSDFRAAAGEVTRPCRQRPQPLHMGVEELLVCKCINQGQRNSKFI